MTINPLTGIYSGSASQLQKSAARIQSTIASLVSGNRITKAADDVASLAIAVQLQAQIGTLRQTAGNISQALSTTQVTADAITQQVDITDRLKQLATQANNGALDADSRKALNQEAKALAAQLDHIAQSTRFNGKKLLDGHFTLSIDQALTGDSNNNDGSSIEVPALTGAALGTDTIDLSTQAGAQAAQALLDVTHSKLNAARARVGSFSQELDYAGASIESALFNQDAARSTLEDTDFSQGTTDLALLSLQKNVALALQAQTNKLPVNVLDLINGLS